jgi:hypothetical protein
MIVGREVMARTHSPTFCRRSANKGSFSTDLHGLYFSFVQCLLHFFAFSGRNRRGPPVVRGPRLRNTGPVSVLGTTASEACEVENSDPFNTKKTDFQVFSSLNRCVLLFYDALAHGQRPV